jgi:hypothetical protein
MAMQIDWHQLALALEYASGESYGGRAVLCRESGKLLLHAKYGDNFDEWPDDVDDEQKYLAIPSKRDLDLGRRLVFAFAREFLPDEYDDVRRFFTRRGAYARFEDLLVRRRALEQWYAFENAATERALRQWCDENGVVIRREDRAPGDAGG